MNIYYFSEEINFKLKQKKKISIWLQRIIQAEGYQLEQLNFIFCTDGYLHAYNKAYLSHDTLTDVITFDYATNLNTVLGDVYISIERVCENAKCYQNKISVELHRVMVHGLLHLLSYNDQHIEEKMVMKTKEDFYLKKLDLF